MKILLIHPFCLEDRIHEEDAAAVPIGLYSIGAMLKENRYDTEILNFHGMGRQPEKIREILRDRQPDIIGFSVLNANRWGAIDTARMAKKMNPKVKIVFGGVAATFLWEHFLKHFKNVDYIIMGEGEHSFLHLVRCLEKGDKTGIGTVPGLAFRKDGSIVKTEPAPPVQNLDSLPNPAKYFTYQHLALTRGCPSDCTFCGSPKFWGRKVRFHSADCFVAQMEKLHQKGVSFFYVSDDTFTLKKSLVIDICQKIIEKKCSISWAAISRADCVDEEILRWMRMAGCSQISYGVESGSEQMRNFMNKHLRTEQICRAFDLTRACGILPRAYFIYGCPGETRETVQESMDLIKKIKPLSCIFYILDVYPGTALYDIFCQKFGITDDIWLKRIEDILWFEYDPQLNKEKILAFGKMLRESFYRNLPAFAENLELIDDKILYPFHADFLSKLAMTFTHGDYANIGTIPDKEKCAENLCRRALRYYPDHRAFLMLGMIWQKQREFVLSSEILREGTAHFPGSEELHLCLGLSLMNLGKFRDALNCLVKFEHSPRTAPYLAECRRNL
ncbi:MAG: cobalamin-dependent protein [Desulfobacterales bacterium]